MKYNNTHLIILLFCALLISCGGLNNVPRFHKPKSTSNNHQQKLAVFIDGTSSNEKNNSNVLKLFNLTALRNDPDLKSIYIKGVGTEYRFIGAATGWGIGHDVRLAYRFLAEQYDANRDDEIFLFGFSRGAYSNRILTGFIRSAGIPKFPDSMPDRKKMRYIKKLYKAYKGKFDNFEQRKLATEEKINPMIKHSYPNITFLGLWDTVEALGLPDSKEDFDYPNEFYDDQLIIVEKAAHAMSINDRRAYLFTPILLTTPRLIESSQHTYKNKKVNKVEEVWFAGAHSDVGGTYEDTFSDNYSLQWMINQLDGYSILPKNSKVFSSFQGDLHFGRDGCFYKILTRDKGRDLKKYIETTNYNSGRLKIHFSVFDRLESGLDPYENGLPTIFENCFTKETVIKDNIEKITYKYKGDEDCCCLEKINY